MSERCQPLSALLPPTPLYIISAVSMTLSGPIFESGKKPVSIYLRMAFVSTFCGAWIFLILYLAMSFFLALLCQDVNKSVFFFLHGLSICFLLFGIDMVFPGEAVEKV